MRFLRAKGCLRRGGDGFLHAKGCRRRGGDGFLHAKGCRRCSGDWLLQGRREACRPLFIAIPAASSVPASRFFGNAFSISSDRYRSRQSSARPLDGTIAARRSGDGLRRDATATRGGWRKKRGKEWCQPRPRQEHSCFNERFECLGAAFQFPPGRLLIRPVTIEEVFCLVKSKTQHFRSLSTR